MIPVKMADATGSSRLDTDKLGLNIGFRTLRSENTTADLVLAAVSGGNSSDEIFTTTTISDANSSLNDSLGSAFEQVPLASAVILIILYTLTTLAALIGNSLAIIVFAKGKRCNTDLRHFLINLAVADLIMAIFCIPFTFAYQITGNWVFSELMCPIVQCCQVVSVTASVSTNTAIGIDRLVAVRFPLRKRVTNSKSKLVILCIWLFAWSLGVIPLIMGRTRMQYGKLQCEEHWPDDHSRLVYTFFIMIITYFLPVTILSVTYTMIGRQLWKHKLPGNADDHRDAVQLKSKRKVVKMLATIVLLFGVCWLPLHLFMIVVTFKYTAFGSAANEIYFGVHWLSMANSFVNPVVYGFMNENFRADLESLAGSCICWPWSRRRLKYQPAAMKWRLGDCDLHDNSSTAGPNSYRSKTMTRHELDNKSPSPQQKFWRNGHAKSSPSFDMSGVCSCDSNKKNKNKQRQDDWSKGNYVGNGGVGRNIFIGGKRRHYEPCGNESSRPNSVEENGVIGIVGNKNNITRGNGRIGSKGDVYPSVLYDGSDAVLLKKHTRIEQG